MDTVTDEQLMSRFCSGATSAFQVLFDRYRDKIFRFVYGVYEQDAARAEDRTQEVFLRVIRSRDSFNPAMRFSTWLYSIARNCCLNELRNRGRRGEWATDEVDQLSLEAPQKDAAQRLETAELGAVIRQAIASLSEGLRAVFMLREVDGLAHAEIAGILNLREGAVRTQLHRAKQQLQQRLKPYLEGET